jgi:hypothetical protein
LREYQPLDSELPLRVSGGDSGGVSFGVVMHYQLVSPQLGKKKIFRGKKPKKGKNALIHSCKKSHIIGGRPHLGDALREPDT